MATAITTVQSYRDAAITALRAGDYDAAKTELASAEIALVGVPFDLMEQGNRIVYKQQFDHIRAEIRRLERESGSGVGAIQVSKITYEATTD